MTAGGWTRVARLASRVGWGVADQGLSSLTNFVLGIFIARTVGLADFGAFSLAFAAYSIVTAFSRAISAQPIVIRYSGVSTEAWRRGTADGTGMSLLLGIVSALGALAVALATDGALRSA